MYAAARLALLTVLLAALAVPAAGIAAPGSTRSTSRLPALDSAVLSALNATRASHGLRPLRLSRGLTAAALQHSTEMVDDDYFDHDSADGTSFDRRVARYYPFSARFRHWAVGENLVFEAPALSASRALALWMASPEHRRNILDPAWREIGIASVHGTGTGPTFGNGQVTVITTDFGARS